MGLDAVELVMAVEETFGITINDAQAAEMITPALLITYIQEAVGAVANRRECISQRAFHRIRGSLMKTLGVRRSEVTPETRLNSLFVGSERSMRWDSFRHESSLATLPDLTLGRGWIFSPRSVKDIVSFAVLRRAEELNESRSWTDEEVRQVVREIIRDQLGIGRFNDSDEFVRDLGMG